MLKTSLLPLAAAVCLVFAPQAQAQSAYPNKAIKFVVPFAPGTAVDVIARLVGDKISGDLKQAVVIENRPGAQGSIGADAVAKAAPDGYTFVFGSTTTHAANPSLFKKLSYDPVKDFEPVAKLATIPYVLAVNADLPVNTVAELIANAKLNPGKLSYAYGSSGNLIPAAIFAKRMGLDIAGIPYKSPPQAVTDTIGGQTQIIFIDMSGGLPHIKSKKLRALAVTTDKPSKYLPDTPVLAKTMEGFDYSTWFGMYAPAGTPKDIVATMGRSVLKAIGQPDVREKLENQGFEITPGSSDELRTFTATEVQKFGKLTAEGNILKE